MATDIPEKSILDQVMDGYWSTNSLRLEIVNLLLRRTELPKSMAGERIEEVTSEFVSSVTISPTDGKIEVVYGGEAHESISGKSLYVIPKQVKTDEGHPAVCFECVPGPGLPSNVICRDCTRPRPERTLAELPIPPVLLSRIRKGSWPRIIRNRKLRQLSQFVTDEEFELFVTVDEILDENQIASLDIFYDLVEDERTAKRWSLAMGSREGGRVDLDTLDLEQTLVIGGGADYGDDKWLVLDYRTDQQDPRVVFNWYQHQDGVRRDEKDPDKYQVTWRELSPSISQLANAVQPHQVATSEAVQPGNQSGGKKGINQITDNAVSKPWWKFW